MLRSHHTILFYLQILCHEVQCYTDQKLVNGECVQLNSEISGNQCFSVLLKIAPAKNVKRFSNLVRHDERAFVRNLRQDLDDKLGLTSESSSLHFLKEDRSGYIEYIVIYAVFVFNNVEEQMRAVDRIFGNIHIYTNPVGDERIFELELELVGYILSLTDYAFPITSAELRVTTGFQPGYETLRQIFNSSEVYPAACSTNNTVPITKLHRCPFVAIPKNALTTETINRHLRVFDDSTHSNLLKVLPSSEYDITKDTILICFRDYLDIYRALSERTYRRSCARKFHSVACIYMYIYAFLF